MNKDQSAFVREGFIDTLCGEVSQQVADVLQSFCQLFCLDDSRRSVQSRVQTKLESREPLLPEQSASILQAVGRYVRVYAESLKLRLNSDDPLVCPPFFCFLPHNYIKN